MRLRLRRTASGLGIGLAICVLGISYLSSRDTAFELESLDMMPNADRPQEIVTSADTLRIAEGSSSERQPSDDDLHSRTMTRISTLSARFGEDASTEQALIEIARTDSSAECRAAALKALSKANSDAVLDLWIEALRDADEWVVDAAEMALFRCSERSRVARKLELSLLDADRETRLATAKFADELITDRLPWNEIYAGPTEIHLPY